MKLAGIKYLVFVLLLTFLQSLTRGEVTVTCVNSEDCVLPCQFQPDGKGVRIMWSKDNAVVSCTHHGDLRFIAGRFSPADEYKGRTRLYADQVLKGNANLVLKSITPKDQGKYVCLTMTAPQIKESAVIVNVKAADTEVSCVVTKSCILPCSFQAGPGLLIHWMKEATGITPVHSYYHNQDQLVAQSQHFRGRTSMFQDQISRGNASLQLTGVKVQDQGLYKCYTSSRTAKKSYINLKVNAPVHAVAIQIEGDRITCSSGGIYPEPELTWSTDPPSSVTFKTSIQQTEQQLYNINSSLILSDRFTDLSYSCTVSTRISRQRRDIFRKSLSDDSTKTGAQSNAGIVIGLVIIALLLAVIAGLATFCICRRKLNTKCVPSTLLCDAEISEPPELGQLNSGRTKRAGA